MCRISWSDSFFSISNKGNVFDLQNEGNVKTTLTKILQQAGNNMESKYHGSLEQNIEKFDCL